ncbi:hypothetical protein DERF_000543 [Dermatophagoides farinae]|uniref:Uncharacterized protein n=1 Tax=Dermatophagoides farinae TaxID=6954 RepID=A0A922LAA1_DERFA|nr:hypothetical protein DERF_000543 [Dermatophagoides farinae]
MQKSNDSDSMQNLRRRKKKRKLDALVARKSVIIVIIVQIRNKDKSSNLSNKDDKAKPKIQLGMVISILLFMNSKKKKLSFMLNHDNISKKKFIENVNPNRFIDQKEEEKE